MQFLSFYIKTEPREQLCRHGLYSHNAIVVEEQTFETFEQRKAVQFANIVVREVYCVKLVLVTRKLSLDTPHTQRAATMHTYQRCAHVLYHRYLVA